MAGRRWEVEGSLLVVGWDWNVLFWGGEGTRCIGGEICEG